MLYLFGFSEPYEFDDDDPDGSHDIGWAKQSTVFEADNDELAIKTAEEIIAQPVIVMGQPLQRKPRILEKIVKKW